MSNYALKLSILLALLIAFACSNSEPAPQSDFLVDFEGEYGGWLSLGDLEYPESTESLDVPSNSKGTNFPSGNINGWYRDIDPTFTSICIYHTQSGDTYHFFTQGDIYLKMKLHFNGSASDEWLEGNMVQYHVERYIQATKVGDNLELSYLNPGCGGVNSTSLIISSITFTNETTSQVASYLQDICSNQITLDNVFKVHIGDRISISVEATNTRSIDNTDYLWFDQPLAVYAHTDRMKVEWYRDENNHHTCYRRFPLLYDSSTYKWRGTFEVLQDQPRSNRRYYSIYIDLIDAETLAAPTAQHMSYIVIIPIKME